MGDAPAFQADNPVNQGIQDFGGHVEPESPLSAPVDKSGPIPDEESSTLLAPVNLPEQQLDFDADSASKAERRITRQPAGTIIPDSGMNCPEGPDNDSSSASPETHAAQNQASGHEETEPADSPATIRDMPGKESSDKGGGSVLQAEEGTGQLGADGPMSSAAEGNGAAEGEVAGAKVADDRRHSENAIKAPETLTVQANATQTSALTSPESSLSAPVDKSGPIPYEDSPTQPDPVNLPERQLDSGGDSAFKADRRHSESSIKGPETLTIQADAMQTTALTSPESSRRIESSVLKASLVPSVPSPDASGNPTLDNTAGRNEVEKALADGGKARQVSPSVDRQARMKSLSNHKDIPRLQKPGEAKGVLRDVQLISRQAMAMASQGLSDMELASVRQTAGKTVSASAGSPGSGPSEPGSPVQHITRPAGPSISPEALRSVPAGPSHADLMPKDGDSFHSRTPLRSHEKKHEAPRVQIGQIDVIIEAAAQPAARPAPAPSSVDLASRHYLRRL